MEHKQEMLLALKSDVEVRVFLFLFVVVDLFVGLKSRLHPM